MLNTSKEKNDMTTKKKTTKKTTNKKTVVAKKTTVKKTITKKSTVENLDLFALYEVKSPSGKIIQNRFRQSNAPISCVFVKRIDSGKWMLLAWTKSERIAKSRIATVTNRHIDKDSKHFVELRYSEATIVDKIRVATVQELNGPKPTIEKPQDRSWVRGKNRFNRENRAAENTTHTRAKKTTKKTAKKTAESKTA